MFEDTKRLYLVRVTKGTLEAEQCRHEENVKIQCAQQRHFDAIDVAYAVVTSVATMIEQLQEMQAGVML